jgi:hypothetical protein
VMFYEACVLVSMLIIGGLKHIYPYHKFTSYVKYDPFTEPCLDFSSDHFSSGPPPKILNQFVTSSLRATRPTQHIHMCFAAIKYFVKYKIIKFLILQFHSLFFQFILSYIYLSLWYQCPVHYCTPITVRLAKANIQTLCTCTYLTSILYHN